MTEIDEGVDYAIEVPNRGWATRDGWPTFALGEEPIYGSNLDDAVATKKRIQKHYQAMGCPEIASTVRIMSRTVTVTRGEWEPITEEPT